MLSEELRRRLEMLNRQPMPGPTVAPAPPHALAATSLDGLLAGEVRDGEFGKYYLVRRSLAQIAPDLAAGLKLWQRLSDPSTYLSPLHPEIHAFLAHYPERLLVLDVETCGFAGSTVFLVGIVRYTADGFCMEQLLARDYSEEHAVLESVWKLAHDMQVLVTFNGKSFDVPMLEDRTRLYRCRRPVELNPQGSTTTSVFATPVRPPHHFDLLHHARRQWKQCLPDCRLQTLERFVCRRLRRGDLPGALVPQAYHRFVRTGDARELKSIVEHNLLDLVTLLQLAVSVATAAEQRALSELPAREKGREPRQARLRGPKSRPLVDCDGGVASRIAPNGQC
jgi:uncharacterized protein YprB with RNaseH-like and TPR domain